MAGNMEKYDSYTLAYDRIAKAMEQGFPLEAIAIEESIIADRLVSYLVFRNVTNPPIDNFGNLISLAKDKSDSSDAPFFEQVRTWKNGRNSMLHGIVKSMPGTAPATKAEDFIAEARRLAEEGLKLTRIVQNWQRKQK